MVCECDCEWHFRLLFSFFSVLFFLLIGVHARLRRNKAHRIRSVKCILNVSNARLCTSTHLGRIAVMWLQWVITIAIQGRACHEQTTVHVLSHMFCGKSVNTRDDVSWRQCDGEERGKFPTVKGFLSGLKSRSPARLYSLRSLRAVVYCCVLTL